MLICNLHRLPLSHWISVDWMSANRKLANLVLSLALGISLLSLFCGFTPILQAQSRTATLTAEDPRGPAELTVCSQNLENFGTLQAMRKRVSGVTQAQLTEKISALSKRIAGAHCDVVAVQELLGSDVEQAGVGLEALTKELRFLTGKIFEPVIGTPEQGDLYLAFLVAKDRAEVLNSLSYRRIELPKLSEKQKPRKFARIPLEIQLKVRGIEGSADKNVTLVTFHLKSKSGAKGDPSMTEWETYRMEMAEALRRIVENRQAASFASGEKILLVLGDRNSHFDEASARILEGTLTLENFKASGVCRLSPRGVPLCQTGAAKPQRLFSVLTSDPETKLTQGTFKYKNEYSWLDEILMPAESLRFAWESFDSTGNYASGTVSQPEGASDHSMVWTRLNW